jgi:hypothetical protein
MKNNIGLFLLLILFFYSCQGVNKIHKISNCPYELYLCLGTLPLSSLKFIQKNQIKQLVLVNGCYIDKNNDGKVDEELLRNYIRKILPNKSAQGVASLDWEGEAIKILEREGIDKQEFKNIEKEYIKAYQIAKSERPNIEWGFYGLPFRDYWNRNEKWRKKNDKLEKILSTVDVIFPSVYDFYKDTNKHAGKRKDSLYVNDNIESALKFGKELNKRVLPFYWHRWHNSNKERGMQLIPWEEFSNHIEAGLSASYQGKKVDGIVWWGADQYFYKVKTKALIEEVKKEENFLRYKNKVVFKYTNEIYNLINQYCRNKS